MPSLESILIVTGIIVGIIAGFATIYQVVYGKPLWDVFRGRSLRVNSNKAKLGPNLPTDPNSPEILKKVIDYLAKGEYQKALDEANKILAQMGYASDADFLEHEVSLKELLLVANAFTLKGEALGYLGRDEGLAILKRAVSLLENFHPNSPSQDQHREHILGRAYNDIAYSSRVHKNYPHAERNFRSAIRHLRRSNNKNANADTLKNLAYTYALQGKLIAAEILCQEAIRIFDDLGDSSGKAFGLNTLGLICVESRQHEIGEIQCKVALGIFQALGDLRGIGLAFIGLAYSLRRLSSAEINPEMNSLASLEKAKSYLNKSLEIFTTKVKEPSRLVETYSELGCVYRDWAKFIQSVDKSKADKMELAEIYKNAILNLAQARELASELGMTVEQADVLEDIAQVYFLQDDYTQALDYLERAEHLVPSDYFIGPNGELPQVKNPITPFWSLLGKVMLLRGHIEFNRSTDHDSSKWYVIAGAYFDLFSESTTLTDYAARSIYDRVRELKTFQLDAWRQAMDETTDKLQFRRTRMMKILDEILGVIEAPSGVGGKAIPVAM